VRGLPSAGRGKGLFGAARTLPCCAALMLLAACGRIGFEAHAPREGETPSATIATTPVNPSDAAPPPMDAGMRPGISTAVVMRDASSPAIDASSSSPPTAAASDNGGACNSDLDCASSACVASVCCAQPCDQPPQCRSVEGASCVDGSSCNYPTPAGGMCDDGDPCTSGDACFVGRCRPGYGLGCDDQQTCTADFCARGACEHASSCNPDQADCSYALHDGHGYWLCPTPVSYGTAELSCQRLAGHIVTINDQSEQDFLWSNGMRDTWIGYTAQAPAADGGFTWGSGPSTFLD
jgi:hypothetical protein